MKLEYPVSRKRVVAKLIWYSPAETHFYGRGRHRCFQITGKGFGMLRDSEGNDYFIYGNEIGGGMYGEDADPHFIQIDREYVITSFWVTPDGYEPPPYHDFFMGTKARVKTIQLKSGRKPSRARYERAVAGRQEINRRERERRAA